MPTSKNVQGLCSRCDSLDIDAILSSKPKTYRGRLISKLGSDIEEQTNSSCPFCSLLVAIKPKSTNNSSPDDYSLYSFPVIHRLWSFKDQNAVLGVLRVGDTKGKGSRDRIEESLCMTGYLASTTPPKFISNSETMAGRMINRLQVDYALFLNWLYHCQSNHNRCSVKGSQQPESLKLINCCTRELEQAVLPCAYLALSYVWGQADQSKAAIQSHKYIIPPSLPKTIEDAITVTKSLGFEYLWVDKYCIDQNNEKEKMAQLQQMDLVYLNAELTIVAGSGYNSDAGLPGVSSVQRTPQPHANVGNHLLVSLMSNPKRIIMDAPWASRGWTFQEAVLSRRLLVFTEEQVYFECRSTNLCETVDLIRDWDGWNIFLDKHEQRGFPWYILDRLEQYSKRNLTRQDDILSAFLGVLGSYRKNKNPVYHHWGVPILPPIVKGRNGWPSSVQRSWSDGFLVGLCWQHMTPGHRRVGFPSWSWVGWNVLLSKESEEYENGLRMQGQNSIEAFVESKNGSLLPVECLVKPPTAHPDLSSYIHLSVHTVPIRFQYDPESACAQPEYLPSGRKPTLGSAYWATLGSAEQFSIQLRLYILQDTNENSGHHGNLIANIFTGIVLGESRFQSGKQNTFIIVTQDTGEYHERIGHLILGEGHIRVIHSVSANVSDWKQNDQTLGACLPQVRRRWVRLG